MPESMTPLIILGVVGALFILLLSLLTNNYSLNNIKSKTVGDGQYGTARWATDQEIRKAYVTVPFDVAAWRAGKKRPTVQGLVLGSVQRGKRLEALVDRDDVHCLMIGASGVGKTAFFLYPNIEFACACGMSFLILDTKGDLARNCGRIAQKYYGYRVSVVDLRNPTRSDGNNLMTLVNRYMDVAREHPDDLKARATAEKYAKILAKTIVNPSGDEQDRGQNSYFYDAAEGVLATVIMTLAEFIPPDSAGHDKRHIMSVFKLMKELMAPMGKKNGFQVLVDSLPDTHKAGWMASAATSSSDQGMASVMSTALSRLNSFIDSEQEQVLCYDSPIDAEHFASEKCAIFLIIPEEDPTKHFMAGLKLYRVQKKTYLAANRELSKAEYLRLLHAARKDQRLWLLLQTLCATGIRVSELQYFTVEAVRAGEISVACKSKTRSILIPRGLQNILLQYVRSARIESGHIFRTRTGKPMNRSNIWSAMKRLCAQANVNPDKVFPHNLRKLFARTFYRMEKDIAKLADILGHSSINTTRIYLMSTGTEHRHQMEKLGLLA